MGKGEQLEIKKIKNGLDYLEILVTDIYAL